MQNHVGAIWRPSWAHLVPCWGPQARTVKRHTLTVREWNALDKILEPSWADRGTIRGPSGGHLGLRCLLGAYLVAAFLYMCDRLPGLINIVHTRQ